MILIRKIRVVRIKNNYRAIGLFKCPLCNEFVERRVDTGLNNKSCGCASNRLTDFYADSNKKSKNIGIYRRYTHMIDRCYNSKNKLYHRYGGRGITVCDEWLSDYLNYRNWCLNNGYSPKTKLQIDRIDNSKGYEPTNCRFTTPAINSQNRDTTLTTDTTVSYIKRLLALTNISCRDIATMTNVSRDMVKDISRHRGWLNVLPHMKKIKRLKYIIKFYNIFDNNIKDMRDKSLSINRVDYKILDLNISDFINTIDLKYDMTSIYKRYTQVHNYKIVEQICSIYLNSDSIDSFKLSINYDINIIEAYSILNKLIPNKNKTTYIGCLTILTASFIVVE